MNIGRLVKAAGGRWDGEKTVAITFSAVIALSFGE